MGRVIITRSQIGRVTRWFLTHHHHPPPSSTTITSFIKQWSTKTKTSSSSNSSEKQQKTLPENIVRLTCSSTAKSGFCEVYLVGNCLISKKYSLEVKTLINTLKPEVVFLELCEERRSLLTVKDIKDVGEPTVQEIIAEWMTKKTSTREMLISLMFRPVDAELEIVPGSEFRVAYEEAMKYGCKVVLGDRPAQITLTRASRRIRLSELKRVFSLIINDLLHWIGDRLSLTDIPMKTESHDMNMDEITRFTREMSKISPTFVETFIHERDNSCLLEYYMRQKGVDPSLLSSEKGT